MRARSHVGRASQVDGKSLGIGLPAGYQGTVTPLRRPDGASRDARGLPVAAAQAELPKKKRRPWSRPLVALLFFLQPIGRGWARYHERLTVRSEPPVFKRPVASEHIDDWEAFGRIAYWSERGADRSYSRRNTTSDGRSAATVESESWPRSKTVTLSERTNAATGRSSAW